MRIVGWGIMFAGWAAITAATPDIPLVSWRYVVLFCGVTLACVGSGIVEAARIGAWPWELRA